MSFASTFSPDYSSAKARFRSAAIHLGCGLESHPIGKMGPSGEPLTIEVATLGDPNPTQAVVVSSGVHGVEGFFGSAVQAAMLEGEFGGFQFPPGLRIIFIHALNPWGMAWRRRTNEDNIDLNRNFLKPDESYEGGPPMYGSLDPLLNPKGQPPKLDFFILKAALPLAKHGMSTLKSAIAGGQYTHPQGLFYGGSAPTMSMQMLGAHLPRLLSSATDIIHIDLHTGLGKSATYKLITHIDINSDRGKRLQGIFGGEYLEGWDPIAGVSYKIRGGIGDWCEHSFPNRRYELLTAEFGTIPNILVLKALRAENQAHHFAVLGSDASEKAKKSLMAAFAPSDITWRDTVVGRGVAIIQDAIAALMQ